MNNTDIKNTSSIKKDRRGKAEKRASYSVMRRILSYALRHKGYFFFGLLLVVCGTALSLIAPILTGRAIDYAVPGNADLVMIGRYCAGIAACIAASGAATWSGNLLLNKLAFSTIRDIRKELYGKLLTLPLAQIEKHNRGDLMTRMSTFGENLSDGLYQGIMQLSAGAVTLIATLVCMFALNWAIAAVVVCLTPISALISAKIAKRNRTTFKVQSENMARMSGMSEEYLSGTRVLRAYGKVADSERAYAEINKELFRSGLSSQFAGACVNPVSRIVNNVVYAVVAVIGGLFIVGSANGGFAATIGAVLTVGELSAFLSYANQFAKPFNDMTSVTAELQTAASAGRKIFELTDCKDEDKGGALTVKSPVGDIELDRVSFSYTDKPFMEDITFAALQGQKIALVGTTGSGKTTIINLIMRFYDITGGKLTFDGTDVDEFSRVSVRRAFGMVLQDTWLFGGTIKENIAYGKPDATDEEIARAAAAAHLDKFVSTLEKGYDTVISGDGEELSEGQKQLIAIARVFLTSPEMLILDEATASVDGLTERAVQSAFAKLLGGKTSFIVAHRLSTIRDSDLIVVMDKGHIIEKGTHDELVALGGYYCEMLKAAE